MVIDATTPPLVTSAAGRCSRGRRSRRCAAPVVRASPATGADGDNVKVGQENQGSNMTQITSPITTAIFGKGITGTGVLGHTDTDTGVFGTAYKKGGYAFGTYGRHKLWQICGVATIPKGKKTITVKPGVDINGKTFVLLTSRSNIGSRGLWYTTNATKDAITIRMSSACSGPTKVAWLTLEWRS